MKKLHILVIRSYLGPLLLTFFIVLFLLVMQFLWKYIDELVGKGLEWYIIAKLIIYASTVLVPMALPLSILLASLMTFGNLGESSELTAMKAAGISLQRIMKPLIYLAIVVSVIAFFFANNVMPVANLKMQSLLYDIRNKQPAFNLKPNTFYNGLKGYAIRVMKKNPKKNMLYKIMIYDYSENKGSRAVIVADSAKMRYSPDKMNLLLTLYHGKKYEDVDEDGKKKYKTYPFQKEFFDSETITFDMSGFSFKRTDESLWKQNYQMLNLSQLQLAIDSLKKDYVEKKRDFVKLLYQSSYLIRYPAVKDSTFFVNDIVPEKYIGFDSVLASTPNIKLKQVYGTALNLARSASSLIETNKDDFLYRYKWIIKHEIEWHKKFTLSIACFILFFIGAPLGAIIRKGGFGMPVVISILFFVFYYVLTITGERLAKEMVVSPAVGMWLPAAVLLPIGVFLTYKATNDAIVLTLPTEFFKKIINRKKKTK
jgi:lipopolysaccharide export system permease protein